MATPLVMMDALEKRIYPVIREATTRDHVPYNALLAHHNVPKHTFHSPPRHCIWYELPTTSHKHATVLRDIQGFAAEFSCSSTYRTMARSLMVAVKALNQAQITLRTVSTHAASVSTNTVAGKTRVLSSTATPTPVCDTTTTPSSPKKVSWLSALFGDSGSSQPKVHRPFGVHEKAHLKLATRKKDKVMQTNPGARVEPEFLPEIESHRLVKEALDVIKKYGISHVSEEQRIEMAHQLKHFPLPKADLKELVNMQRVTGVSAAYEVDRKIENTKKGECVWLEALWIG